MERPDPDQYIHLPSGQKVHPCRLIQKDGTLMWKDALHWSYKDGRIVPSCHAHEAHIIKTAQRLEELHCWVNADMDIWDGFIIQAWYRPRHKMLTDGISVFFTHRTMDATALMDALVPHILEHESLEQYEQVLFFKRC